MKKLSNFLLCLIFCALANAQETTTLKVSVGGVTHRDSLPIYKATVQLGTSFNSYSSDLITIASLKEGYKQALKENGIDASLLLESPNGFGYETLGYQTEGAVYTFTTTSLKEMRNFMKVRPLGVESLYVVCQMQLDQKETEALIKTALLQAKIKGRAIADAMRKKLGKIKHIDDRSNKWGNTFETTVYYDRVPYEYEFTLDITFEIID